MTQQQIPPIVPRFNGYDICILHDCNLRCRYCSTGFGRWGKQSGLMTFPIIDKVVSFMLENGNKQFRISFSGGETLLAFDHLQYFIEKTLELKTNKDIKVLFELSTNGFYLTKKVAEYLVEKKVSLTFSIDGDRATTERNRLSLNGNSVYDAVKTNLVIYKSALLQNGCSHQRIKAECTIDEKANLYDSVIHLFDMGFDDVIARPAENSRYTGYNKGNSHQNYLSSLTKLINHVLQPLDEMDILIGNYKKMFLNIKQPVISMITGKSESSTCDIMKRRICILADGRIVPCFLLNSYEDEPLDFGNVFTGLDNEKVAQFMFQSMLDIKNLSLRCNGCCYKQFCRICLFELMRDDHKKAGFMEPDFCSFVKKLTAILIQEVSQKYNIRNGSFFYV